jgi:predicted nucleic acid-binding protein
MIFALLLRQRGFLRITISTSRSSALRKCISLPETAAEACGTIRAELESKGEMIGNNYLWIAAHAVAAGLTLVTDNEKEFRRVSG